MRRLALVVFPGFQLLDTAALTVFELVNTISPDSYAISVVSESGGLVPSSLGVSIQTTLFDDQAYDTLMIAGGTEIAPSADGLLERLRQSMHTTRRMASICTGAFVLAEAGLLAGRRVTTHWFHAPLLQRLHPTLKIEPDRIFIRDGQVWTSAGMSACMDLALALLEDDLGAELARDIAKRLVVQHRRSGGQSQFSVLSELETESGKIRTALDYAKTHLHESLPVEKLAEIAHLSTRQFSRAFRSSTGLSPAKAIEKLRLETARALVDAGQHPVDRIAATTGFHDGTRMRRAFLRAYGATPRAIRRDARARMTTESDALRSAEVDA